MNAKPPANLSAHGRQLWADVVTIDPESWNAGRLAVLVEAIRILDRLDQVRKELAAVKKLTTKTTGGPAAHPLLKMEQSLRRDFVGLWNQLDLGRHPNPLAKFRPLPAPTPTPRTP